VTWVFVNAYRELTPPDALLLNPLINNTLHVHLEAGMLLQLALSEAEFFRRQQSRNPASDLYDNVIGRFMSTRINSPLQSLLGKKEKGRRVKRITIALGRPKKQLRKF
jgi:hypothetical protein